MIDWPEQLAVKRIAAAARVDVARPSSGLDPLAIPPYDKRLNQWQKHFRAPSPIVQRRSRIANPMFQFCGKNATANSDGQQHFPSQQGQNPSNALSPMDQLDGVSTAPPRETACTSGDHGADGHCSSAGHRFAPRTSSAPN
jgi:hypothetical protein